MDLFEHQARKLSESEAPLAARMRPRSLDEYVGQDHILGPGRLLRRAIEADRLSSLIFYGPPGTGKTTLARVIANTTRGHFIAINAVLAGVKDIREAIEQARARLGQQAQRTILFVDEVHRFNKAQQDALLPWVENGTVILVGATTENPYFEVNKALVSRSRVFQLRPLEEHELVRVAWQALQDRERGYGDRPVRLRADALEHLVNVANGDARAMLNALELAVETTPASLVDPQQEEAAAAGGRKGAPKAQEPPQQGEAAAAGGRRGAAAGGPAAGLGDLHSPTARGALAVIDITLPVAEESIQRRAVLYDKEGDVHFDTISAFIKSVRGSDPDASLYWLARMVYAGEDPRFILRRLIILASEDIGLADPHALGVVVSCAEAFERIGMPEGRYPLAQATLYLATAPKSNTTMAFFDALAAVEKEREADVPNALKDASRDKESFGHGQGYLYPHAYRDHWVAQQYLPTALQGRTFYAPSDQGYEGGIRDQTERRREAQLAAMVEGSGLSALEVLTFSPQDRGLERWLQRTIGNAGARLERLREALFTAAAPQRHHTVLDLNAATGLLTWEAVRAVPEGLVVAWAPDARDADALIQRADALPELRRPLVLGGPLEVLAEQLEAHHPGLRIDRLVGRNALVQERDKARAATLLHELASADARLALAETLARRTQRIVALVPESRIGPGDGQLDEALHARWLAAEEALYTQSEDPMLDWDRDDLIDALESAGWSVRSAQVERSTTDVRISEKVLERWFDPLEPRAYVHRLQPALDPQDIVALEAFVRRVLGGQTVAWATSVVVVVADCR